MVQPQTKNGGHVQASDYFEAGKKGVSGSHESAASDGHPAQLSRVWSDTFDTMTDFISVHSQEMKLLRVNKSLALFLGESPEDLAGRYCYKVLHKQAFPWSGCPHISAIKNNTCVTREVDDPDIGIPLLISCSPFCSSNGNLIGSVHMARDISEQKQTQIKQVETINQLNRSLENIKQLSGILPVCSSCKKIRNSSGRWEHIEIYIKNRSDATFSHGMCSDCSDKLYGQKEWYKHFKKNKNKNKK